MTLTPEQQQFWNALKGPEYHCHRMARDILAVKGRAKRFHQRIDQHLDTLMHLYKGEEVVRVLHTWLSVYKMPINPCQLIVYDRFHDQYSDLIMQQSGKIKPY